MPEMYLRQLEFIYSSCIHLQKYKESIQKLKETADSIYQNDLDKACVEHCMVYRDFKNLTRRSSSDKILHNKVINVDKNPKYHGH